MRTLTACGCVIATGLMFKAPVRAQEDNSTEADVAASETSAEEQSSEGDSLEQARARGQNVRIGKGTGHLSATAPEVYQVKPGDTLWSITERYYGDPELWPKVWSHNPEVTNPHWVYPDQSIRLRLAANTDAGASTESASSRALSLRPTSILLREEGFLDRDALESAGVIAGSRADHMMLSEFDEVYVKFSNNQSIEPGKEFTVFRVIGQEERDRGEQGVLVRILGTIRMLRYDQERGMATGVITEALDPIERGFQVAPVIRKFNVVDERPNDRRLDAKIIATIRPRTMSADYEVVFINAGSAQGVQVGNQFVAVRSGDTWHGSLSTSEANVGATVPNRTVAKNFPSEVVAEARVVHVRPQTSALMIVRSLWPLTLGEKMEMRPAAQR